MLKDLGVKTTKALPNALVDAAGDGEPAPPSPAALPPMSLFDEGPDPEAPLN